jgi:ribosomal protein S18 acetylase RimI-like enzyme
MVFVVIDTLLKEVSKRNTSMIFAKNTKNDSLLGFLVWTRVSRTACAIIKLVVAKESRGSGIGSGLLDHALRHIR